MFGHESQPSRIWSYRARTPIDGLAEILRQARNGLRYRNTLVQLERTRRDAVNAVVRLHAPRLLELEAEIATAEAELEAVVTEIKAARIAQEAKTTGTVAQRACKAEIAARLKALRKEVATLRKETFARPDVRAALAEVEARAVADGKAARAASGLYHGTYGLVELSRGQLRQGPPPRFRHTARAGAISLQIINGLSWEEVLACEDNRLRVQLLPAGLRSHPDRPITPQSARGRKRLDAIAWIRIGSHPDRSPIWARVPFRLPVARTPPPGVRIKRVTLHLPDAPARVPWEQLLANPRLLGNGPWELQLVLSAESEEVWAKPGTASDGVCAINPGWRRLPNGALRVAYLVADDGTIEELTIPEERVEEWAKVASLRSIRDRHRDEILPAVADWLTAHRAALPEGLLRQITARAAADVPLADRPITIARWDSCDRLARLAIDWQTHRAPGDDEILAALLAWRRRDNHLANYAAGLQSYVIAWRKDLYYRFVDRVRRRWKSVRVADVDYRALIAQPDVDESDDAALARKLHRVAAPGMLVSFLHQKVGEVVSVPAGNLTRKCHHCASIEDFPARSRLRHTCRVCGCHWDQDDNHCRNLLAAEMQAPAAALVG